MRDNTTPTPTPTGRFTNVATGVTFYYAQGVPPWATTWFKGAGVTHTLILENTGAMRGCRVLKSVVWVIVDENDDGTPRWERWSIRNHRQI